MKEVVDQFPQVSQYAREAIERAGVPVINMSARGGTDGSRLCDDQVDQVTSVKSFAICKLRGRQCGFDVGPTDAGSHEDEGSGFL